MLNWSAQENCRRIVFNLVRYSFIDKKEAKRIFSALKKMVKDNDMTYSSIRELAASISRNADEKSRKKSANSLIIQLKKY